MNKNEVVAIIQRVVKLCEDHPDVIYISKNMTDICSYLSGDTKGTNYTGTGCIFGQAIMIEAPHLKDKLEEVDISRGGNAISCVLDIDNSEMGRFCVSIQTNQDNGRSWGECLAKAGGREEWERIKGIIERGTAVISDPAYREDSSY